MSALPLSCISTSVSVLSFLALLQVQGRWHSKLPIGMDGNHFSKSACDALYSTYKQGGSSGNHPNFIPSETRSPYSAGCLPFCNERKTIIPNCLTSWAQTQQKTCHNYWQGMHCRVNRHFMTTHHPFSVLHYHVSGCASPKYFEYFIASPYFPPA